jgi:hypothetical protein
MAPGFCPECGGRLYPGAWLIAEARHATRRTWARLVLLGSPFVAIVASIASVMVMARGWYAILPLVVLVQTGAAFVCLYYGSRRTERRLRLALIMALPLGLAYLIGVVLAALVIVWGVVTVDHQLR